MTDEEWAEYRARNEIVSREEQERRGLLPQRRPRNFVSMPQAAQPVRFDPHQVDLAINHPTTQHVELRTSAVDRAQGFQWMITPISIVVAFFALLVSFAFNDEWMSLISLWVFFGVFTFVYVAGWILTVLVTPEFISLYSANRQWNVVEREQKERWSHYKWQSGRTIEARQRPQGGLSDWILATLGVACFVVAVVIVLYLVGV